MCEMSFFKLFLVQLTFLMSDNLPSSSFRQSPSKSYRDSKSNPYSIEVISLMMTMLLALNPAIQDAF